MPGSTLSCRVLHLHGGGDRRRRVRARSDVDVRDDHVEAIAAVHGTAEATSKLLLPQRSTEQSMSTVSPNRKAPCHVTTAFLTSTSNEPSLPTKAIAPGIAASTQAPKASSQ